MKKISKYFKNGIQLANANIYFFAYYLGIFIVSFAISSFRIPLIGIILSQLLWGYSYSVPMFIKLRKEKKVVTNKEIITTTLDNAKKLIPAAIVTLVAFMGLMFLFGLLIYALFPDKKNAKDLVNTIFSNMKYFSFLFGIISPISIFTTIFFSLEKLNFFTSVAKSIVYCIKNIKYVLLLIGISMLLNFIEANIGLTNKIFNFILSTVDLYISYLLLSVSFLYYLENKKK